MKYLIFLLLLNYFFITGCQSIKDGLSGVKRDNSDEFLVKKKNPLVVPPEFGDLPEPNQKQEINIDENEIQILLDNVTEDTEDFTENDNLRNFEEFILKEINKD